MSLPRVLSQPISRLFFLLLVASLPIAAAIAEGFTLPWQRPATLESVEEAVADDYPDVLQISVEEFDAQRRSADHVVVLDAREPGEFAVSHLQGAIRVDPDARPEAVLAAIAPIVKDTRVVVYCSVGVRSSRLAERTQVALKSAGASSIANLRGGIFSWYDQRRPLVDAQGPTEAVHGFNAKWARLIRRRDGRVVILESVR